MYTTSLILPKIDKWWVAKRSRAMTVLSMNCPLKFLPKKKRCNVRLSKDIYVEIRLSPQLENSYAVIQMLEEQVCANSCCIGSWWPDIACRSPAASDATLHFWVKNAECSEGRGETQTSPRRFAHLNCCNWGLDTQSLCPQRTSFPCIEGYSKARTVMLESFTCDGIELQKWWCIISDGVNTSSQQKMVFCFDAFPSHDHLHIYICLSITWYQSYGNFFNTSFVNVWNPLPANL